MDEKQVYQNILAFMDRVQVTGRQEVAVYAECCNFVQEKVGMEVVENNPKEKQKKAV